MATKNLAVFKRNDATGTFLVDVPRDVSDKAGLKEGDPLVITTTQDGRIIIRLKSGKLRDLRGVVRTKISASDATISNRSRTQKAQKRK